MYRRRWFALLIVLILAAGALPAAALAAPPADRGNNQDGPDTDARVCTAATAPATAQCHARVRTDAKIKGKVPVPGPGGTATPNAIGNGGAYDPAYLQSAYNLKALAASAGAGRTVAIVDAYDNPTAEADLGTYRSYFGLPACTTGNGCFRKVNQRGAAGPYPAADAGWGQEIALDIDMVSAVCPRCTILLIEADSSGFNDLAAAVDYAATVPGVVAIGNSYGGGEWSGETALEGSYHHPGIAVTASSGDSGYGVQFPAASQYVTAVGGTTLNQADASGARNATETAWSGAGSGCSAYEPKPTWQADRGCGMRTVADVAAVADPSTGVWVYDGSWLVFGGTSVAAPVVAAVYALGGAPGATPNATPYAHPAALFDVVGGSNGSCGGTYLCTAVGGYDGPTGLGTPNGAAAFGVGAPADFSLAAPSPGSATATRGGAAATYTLTLGTTNGYTKAVQLTVAGVPGQVTATFSPNPLTPTSGGAQATLSVRAGARANRGTYTLTITGTGPDGTRHTTTAQLTIR